MLGDLVAEHECRALADMAERLPEALALIEVLGDGVSAAADGLDAHFFLSRGTMRMRWIRTSVSAHPKSMDS